MSIFLAAGNGGKSPIKHGMHAHATGGTSEKTVGIIGLCLLKWVYMACSHDLPLFYGHFSENGRLAAMRGGCGAHSRRAAGGGPIHRNERDFWPRGV